MNIANTNPGNVGAKCKAFRLSLGFTQKDVAKQLKYYSPETVSAFERGRTDNYRILLWYLCKGLTLEELGVI